MLWINGIGDVMAQWYRRCYGSMDHGIGDGVAHCHRRCGGSQEKEMLWLTGIRYGVDTTCTVQCTVQYSRCIPVSYRGTVTAV